MKVNYNHINLNKIKNTCDRCGWNGHTIDDCYAKKDINWKNIEESEEEVFGCSNCDKECDTLKWATCHENLICKVWKK